MGRKFKKGKGGKEYRGGGINGGWGINQEVSFRLRGTGEEGKRNRGKGSG